MPNFPRSIALTCAALCWLSAAKSTLAQTPTPASDTTNPVIDVGVVQRFGSDPAQTLTLQPPSGQNMTLKFETNGQPQTITTANGVKLEVGMVTLPQPQVNERIILSSHRSFESAEDSANQLRSKGIDVEIAQPRGWQVWASRETYQTPLLRRLLLQNLQANGSPHAVLDTQVQTAIPKAAIVLNGYRYQRDRIEVTIPSQRLFVTENQDTNDRRLYAGSLRLQPNAYGTYTLVNTVPIESYLRGVVPHEIGVGAPQPAIEAQAVLARTYALRNLRRFAIDDYQLCADTQCQVYEGVGGAAANTDRAIASTAGLVLTYNNELVDALYSSTTGGITAPFSDVWNGPDRPYLKAVVDAPQPIWDLDRLPLSDENNLRAFIGRSQGFNEDGWAQFRWRRQTTLAEIAAGLKQYLQNTQRPMANLTQVRQVQVLERSPAGRVQKMAIETDVGTIELQKDEILRALYPPTSTLFYLEPIYESAAATPADPAAPAPRILKGYTFVGGGLGHGVGMSQTGAYNLGDLGWSGAQILSFYYPNTQLQRLNDSIAFWRDPAATP